MVGFRLLKKILSKFAENAYACAAHRILFFTQNVSQPGEYLLRPVQHNNNLNTNAHLKTSVGNWNAIVIAIVRNAQLSKQKVRGFLDRFESEVFRFHYFQLEPAEILCNYIENADDEEFEILFEAVK